MISNQDNYLVLKQFLTIIQSQRNGLEVGLNGKLIEPEQTSYMALNRLKDIEDDFTVPQFTTQNDATTIDFERLIEAINFWASDITDEDPENEAMGLVIEVSQPDNLYRSIVEYPNVQSCVAEHKVILATSERFPVNQQTVIDAAHAVDNALIMVNKWITEDSSFCSLAQLIILLNCVQLLDEMFQFGNDRFIGY